MNNLDKDQWDDFDKSLRCFIKAFFSLGCAIVVVAMISTVAVVITAIAIALKLAGFF